MTPDKTVEEIVKEFIERNDCILCYGKNQKQADWLRTTLTQYHQDLMSEVVEDILKMADALETECGKDGDKGTKQWMAFKGFRNTIRDKYIIKSK